MAERHGSRTGRATAPPDGGAVILVDTSVWVDQLRGGHARLTGLLDGGQVLGHAWVTGEPALGRLAQRREILRLLGQLPQAAVASEEELLALVERHELHGLGIG